MERIQHGREKLPLPQAKRENKGGICRYEKLLPQLYKPEILNFMQVKGQNNINVKGEENLIKQGILCQKILTLN